MMVRRVQYTYIGSYGNEILDEVYFDVVTGIGYDLDYIANCFS
jgi:hypothetical protein